MEGISATQFSLEMAFPLGNTPPERGIRLFIQRDVVDEQDAVIAQHDGYIRDMVTFDRHLPVMGRPARDLHGVGRQLRRALIGGPLG
ncbi:Hypothetical protein RG1141_PA08630 (plasmid) [Neorhizobium galegae bv. officinalis bv. officinalis str. HAMBI 1141]|uniref:Uncharacterized protein n=1 Tax=Neorhizobium galegae bv. officinalis bv. officinalis str. HAMBI 1141 TaxID=1028801 RepID=A0A068TJJ5_NEOGA|nr:hypothetical protein [Neorhizobium galegae]CDN57695.1 Hypothetical protein RG1141_PA08630 [Neorhizobium galegae bv. officinalis bv. officinalis str. HAMBI 1141]